MHDITDNTIRAEALLLDGTDALHFAQSQFASDIARLEPGHWQWSSWLDAQGRVKALLQLVRDDDGRLHALLRGGAATVLADALRRYVFRSRVRIDVANGVALATGDALPMHHVETIAGGWRLGMGERSLLLRTGDAADTDTRWLAADIHDGFPWLPGAALDRFLPPALGLYRLGAVATDKGCYPGQEIVARLHFKSGHKWHLHRFGPIDRWHAGQDIVNGAAVIGMVLACAGNEALAIVRDNSMAGADLPSLLESYAS